MSREPYRRQVFYMGRWRDVGEGQRGYLLGYLAHHQDAPGPKCAMRVVQGDRVVEAVAGNDEVSIGMVAGWPTAEQYQAAGERALEHARLIRERVARRAERRAKGEQP